MATQKQIEANRLNALKSTGPQSEEGKAASSRNALKHGVLSTRAVSEYEDGDEYQALLNQLVEELEPVSIIECTLVERIANLLWREKRLAAAEANKITSGNRFADAHPTYSHGRDLALKDQHLIGRYQGMLGRQLREALQELRDEQERRLQLVEQDELPKA